MHHLAYWANVVHTFCPVTTHSSPCRVTARVFSEARSEPESGSEKPWHQISSPTGSAAGSALLLLGPVGDHGRPAHREAEHVRGLGRLRAHDLSSL
jgi:hypothetical protein